MHCIKQFFHLVQNKSVYCNKINVARGRLASVQNIFYRFNHSGNESEASEEEAVETELYNQICQDYLGLSPCGHRVFVLQPYIKWGRDKKRNTTPQLQLAEAVALVNTLPEWTVVGQKFAPLLTLQKKKLLGSGALENLQKDIGFAQNVTAIFVSTNLLRFVQIDELQKALGLPVYDRYSIVIHIFRQHAKSPEAKLQVALAEIPYIRKKMRDLTEHHSGRINLHDRRKLLLESRERKLKNGLKKLEEHRKVIRSNRKGYGFPTIAVVGYTNAGKTSLIKALTGDVSLEPENKLFATLDTTVHQGILPSKLKVLYVDTIGFIQDVPESLIEPFKVTLEDAIIADIIVHVYDISHPDVEAQVKHVEETIRPMIDADKVVIKVANKCDIVEKGSIPKDTFGVSATKLTRIDLLREKVEQEILANTGLLRKRMRVRSGSAAEAWLYKEATVTNVESDSNDSEYFFMDVIMTTATFYKFKRFLKQ